MMLMPEADSDRTCERAAEARHEAIGRLAGYAGTPAEREELAGTLFRKYSCELLEDLLRVAPMDDNGDGWLRRRHDEELLELGRELRDAFPEGEARHAVAQVIQRELLEAERRLKCALTVKMAGVSALGKSQPTEAGP